MREFLLGWRRKTGCTLLLFAVVLCCLWARSCLVCDTLSAESAASGYCVTSVYGRFIWETHQPPPGWKMQWDSGIADFDWFSPWVNYGLLPTYELAGLEYGAGDPAAVSGGGHHQWLVVPYVWLVLPATLLAAYLILIKQTPKLQREARDVPNQVS